MNRESRRWRRLGLGTLALVLGIAGCVGWRQAPAARNPLQVRFVGLGTNQWIFATAGLSNLVFEVHNRGVLPLYLAGTGKFSDWPLAEALSSDHLWLMDRQWFSTNRMAVIPPMGSLTLSVFAQAQIAPPGEKRGVRTAPAMFSTFINEKHVWRFRFRTRHAGVFDLVPSVLSQYLPPGSIPNPRHNETVVDIELPVQTEARPLDSDSLSSEPN